MADEKLIFPIGFDLEEGVKQAGREWKNHYRKRLQDAIDSRPLKVKIDFESKGIDTKEFKQWMVLSREAEKIERERIKNAKEWQKVADQAAMAETRRANATNESNARIERANRKAEASEQRKRTAVERTNTAYKTQGNYLSRLFQRMVAYASVAQAFSFVRNVRDVTAEFELRRVALGSIIGDLNEANAMFEQIKAAAVKSPFQIKELVTYTKQLAAYKIETDELFETTQRLADISAGIGVGMERLVLAYGQISATGYLRASEVRQLTEAGIPIVEELAKKMSQLRGETVSAAEVMGLISERAISFGMVKEVFDDMTSAGGMFYKMQEKQAETLAGQWSNLKDSIAIMYEEIGNTEGVNNSIKGTIGLVKSLAENWRTVAVVMVTALEGYGVYKGFSALLSLMTYKTASLATTTKLHAKALERSALASMRFGKVGRLMTLHLRLQTKLLKDASRATTLWGIAWRKVAAFLAGNFWNIALIGIGAIVAKIVSARIEANRLNKELERIGTEGDVQSRTQVNNFERLAKVIRDSADGSLRQTEALKEMKRAYGEFLPSQDKEIINLVRAKEGYEAVSQAIREKIALQVQEQKVNAVTSEYSKIISDYLPDLKTLLEPDGIDVSRVYSALKTAIEDGSLTLIGSVKEDAEAINAILEKELGITLDLFTEGRLLTIKGWKSVFNPSRAMELLRPILNAETELRNAIQDIEYDLLSDTGITGIYAERWEELQKKLKGIAAKGEVGSFEWNKDKTRKEIELYHNFIKERIAEINKDLSDDKKIKFDIGDVLDFDALDEALGDNYPQLKQVIAKIQKEYEKLVPTDITRLANDKLQEYAEKVGISMDEVKEHLKTNEQSTEDWAKGLKGAYESAEKKLAEYKKNQEAFSKQGAPFRDWSEDIEETTKEMKVLKLLMDFFKEFLKGGDTKQRKSQLSILQEELQLHEKIYAKYKEYRQYMSAEEAKAKVEDYFGDTIKSLMFEPKYDSQGFKQVLKQYQDYARTLPESEKIVLDIGFKVEDIDWQDTKTELEDSLKKLSDQISRTKTAKEFFDRMLGLTGDKELSATLTLSVYGTTGDDLQRLMAQQVTDAFKNLPKGFDITKAMLGGGKFDYNLLGSWIEKLPKDDRTLAQSIVDNWRKANADILTDLQKSYEDFMTYEERKTRVVERQIAERKKIEESQYDDDEKAKLIKASEKSRDRELADIAIEEFKASEDWAKLFEDLENLATPTIERLMAKLKEFIDTQEDLTPEQLKTLTNEYKKLYDGLIQRNPFKAISDGVKEYKMSIQGIKLAQEQLTTAIALGDEELIAFAERGLTDAFDEAQKASTKLKKGVDAVGDQFSQAASDIQFFANALGFSEDSYATQFLNGMANAFKGVSIAIGFADIAMKIFDGTIKGMLASNPIGWILLAVSAIISAVQAIMNARINRINKEIEALEDKLDNLEYAYDRLQKSAERAFGTEYIQNYQRQLDNLEAQVEAYEKQLDLERSKGKKADEDKIKEYENQIRDTKDAIEDMYGSLSEHFLGTDLTSAARDFASAWIDAYKEFANTTDAMKAKFQDMIQNMIVESLIAKVMERALEPVFKMVENMGDSDFYSNSFWSQLMTEMNKATENGVVGAQNIMGMLESIGINLRDTGTGLTGISRDIASASEESILGLAAGINTQNFYISQVPTKLDTIIGLLRGGSAVVDSGVNVQDLITIQNQFLSHLPTIAQNTAETVARCERAAVACESMASKLGSVIKPKGTTSTHSVNVTIGS